jgi:hypothetical protein
MHTLQITTSYHKYVLSSLCCNHREILYCISCVRKCTTTPVVYTLSVVLQSTALVYSLLYILYMRMHIQSQRVILIRSTIINSTTVLLKCTVYNFYVLYYSTQFYT